MYAKSEPIQPTGQEPSEEGKSRAKDGIMIGPTGSPDARECALEIDDVCALGQGFIEAVVNQLEEKGKKFIGGGKDLGVGVDE